MLEVSRILAIFIYVLNVDGSVVIILLPEFLRNSVLEGVLLQGVVATIAIDSTVVAVKKLKTKKSNNELQEAKQLEAVSEKIESFENKTSEDIDHEDE